MESRARILISRPEDADRELEPGVLPLPVNAEFFAKLRPELAVDCRDTRGRSRQLRIVSVNDTYAVAHCDRTCYFAPGVELTLVDWDNAEDAVIGSVQPFDPAAAALSLSIGQSLVLKKGSEPGRNATLDEFGKEISHASISCDLEAVFADTKPGQPISFDDGKIEGEILETRPDHLVVRIMRSAKNPGSLQTEKGINLPETKLSISGLTEKDIEDLDFAAEHGNMVALSFVRTRQDVEHLISELNRRGAEKIGIILKIETHEGFANLPLLLLTALKHPPVAVMIARGDLGVELGFERMAEVQEEILWLCEAAHVPVIWATQVLESLAKKGLATRGEITDAAMSGRAECVMLNKGPHIARAVRTLHDILERMAGHQSKKTSTLRKLSVASQPVPVDSQ